MIVNDILNRVKVIENVTTDKEVAAVMGTNQRTLAGWRLRNKIPFEYIEEYATLRHLSFDYLIDGKGYPYTQLIDLGEDHKAIIPSDMINIPLEEEDHTDVIAVPKSFLNHGLDENTTAYYVMDDSMAPYIKLGSIIFVSKSSLAITSGSVYRIRYDKEVYLKAVFKSVNGYYSLVSNDPKHPEWELKREDFDIIGRVVAMTSRL